VVELIKRTKEHCGKGMPEEVRLLELGWYMKEVIVTYVQCKRCEEKGYYVEKNRRQRVIKDRQRWYKCQKKEGKKTAYPIQGKAQQSSV